LESLQVYALATAYGLDKVASKASEYLKPIASYGIDEVKMIPTVEAYHKIAQFQDYRVKAMRELVLVEEIFPHGYRLCARHQETTESIWNRTRKAVAARIEIGIDIAGEMAPAVDAVRSCDLCHRAGVAAVDMLSYKCQKVPSRLSQWLLRKDDV